MTEPKPEWLRVRYNARDTAAVAELAKALSLNTVCREANCPNLGECYRKRTATFMILGRHCTRNCRFCNVEHACPDPVDPEEPAHLAEAVRTLGLRHAVLTSVTRDDLPDGGAAHFAACVEAIRALCPDTTCEVLIPDLQGSTEGLDRVIASRPAVINHNLETVPRLYPTARPEADYRRSLDVIAYVHAHAPGIRTKTGIMLGLGETREEILSLMDDALAAGCDILTMGQYLRPSESHLPVVRYLPPEEFDELGRIAKEKGFAYVASSPLARSSYRAAEAME